MSSSRSQRKRNKHKGPALRLPSSRDVTQFREQRLLIHLHEQLIEQLEVTPNDWILHFQLANLLAFSDDYSYSSNKQTDINDAETHYQKALKLLQQLHEQDYTAYQNRNGINVVQTPVSPFVMVDSDCETGGAILYEDTEEEKYTAPTITTTTMSINITSPNNSNRNEPIEGNNSGTESDDSYSGTYRNRQRKKKKRKKRKRSKKRSNKLASIKELNDEKYSNKDTYSLSAIKTNIDTTSLFDYECTLDEPLEESPKPKIFKKIKRNKGKPKKMKIKKRKLLIKVVDDDEKVAQEIKCNYKSAMSEEEIQIELEKKRKTNKKQTKTKVMNIYQSIEINLQ